MSDLSNFKDKVDTLYKLLDFDSMKGFPGVIEIFDTKNSSYSTNIGRTASKYIEIEGNKYFVKYPALGGEKHEFFTELFTSFIAKKLGIDCIDANLLIDHSVQALGVISPDFGEHVAYSEFGGEIDYYSHWSTSVMDIIERLEARIDRFTNVSLDSEKLRQKLNKISCFDYLISQRDRHGRNIAFQIKQEHGMNYLDLAPLYDNGNAFMHSTDKFFKISPNNSHVYGVEEQKLLNVEFHDMLDWFSTNFSDKNFDALIHEFNEIYGLDKIYIKEHYLTIKDRIKNTVQYKIKQCQMRKVVETFIPLEVVYAVIKRHMPESAGYEYHFAITLAEYYGEDSYSHSYTNFYKEKHGEITAWKWYDECLELASNMDDPEVQSAKEELANKRRTYYAKILQNMLEHRPINHNLYDDIQVLLFNGLEKRYVGLPKEELWRTREYGFFRICQEYSVFKALREWCSSFDITHASAESKQEYRQIKRLLKQYIRFINSFTNNKLKYEDIERLQRMGLEIDKTSGLREVRYES